MSMAGASIHAISKLNTLKEEEQVNVTSGKLADDISRVGSTASDTSTNYNSNRSRTCSDASQSTDGSNSEDKYGAALRKNKYGMKILGLGISHQGARRPSDNLFQNVVESPTLFSNYDFTRRERPNSSDSSVTATSDLFSPSIPNSGADTHNRNQSSISVINESEEALHKQPQTFLQMHANSTSMLLAHPSTANATNNNNNRTNAKTHFFMTPSQRYRLRRSQTQTNLRESIRRKDTVYPPDNVSDTDDDNDIVEDADKSFIWNVPVAHASTSSFIQTPEWGPQRGKHRSQSVLDFNAIPTMGVPGIDGGSDSEFMKATSMSLSYLYDQTSNRLSHQKLTERNKSADVLPLEYKRLSDQGLEDLRLVSDDKKNVMSQGRPMWLPPKSTKEKRSHEREIYETMESYSREALAKQKWLQNYSAKLQNSEKELGKTIERGLYRQSSLQMLHSFVQEMPFCSKNRFEIYSSVLQTDNYVFINFVEKFEELSSVLKEMDFPKDKELQIKNLINDNIERGTFELDNKLYPALQKLLELKAISTYGITPGDELLMYHFLKEGFPPENTWLLVNLVQLTCFNSMMKDKYDRKILQCHYLKKDVFKQEFNSSCLNMNTWWNMLERVSHTLFLWILDIVVIYNVQLSSPASEPENQPNEDWDVYAAAHIVPNYKILLSFTVNILMNHHYGFDDLVQLRGIKDVNIAFPMPAINKEEALETNYKFVETWLSYYKKL
ncbi:Sbe2p KNAG_0C05110 [Huiozyma naganishii CBS 8797]|uniref:Protein SBE22 n=1 Tax=Huiozyma naganishii (strain ATCC MYA-139 / BCRC 22969 / CBS 8797 / KCTC 17520 / NBRC 10181 / NCYC 3082 / Yp74L-3) TaxID=1071383 RepID=J7RX41_HUIN7|nr:hypothetical protein KNAG_0C05110 [Kazachstania naganishii CBS 8797]CCK69612.1 hypothetical protein KNAG_0C05110 [Kazachstania naganishii CBS 8797]